MNLSFQNRIALNYMVANAVIMAMVFGFIYFVLYGTVYLKIDSDLQFEAVKHIEQLKIENGNIHFIDESEWEEEEHTEVQINPMFMQVTDHSGRLISKSPNLKTDTLAFHPKEFNESFSALLNGSPIRQIQVSLEKDGIVKGYIITAMSLKSTLSILSNLRNVLGVSFVVMLIGLYFTSRFIAGRSIEPIKTITETINRITKNNINERVDVPVTKDEVYVLAISFNELLERIEKTIKRERQFTSDASHELRTPLAAIRGTLEVLVRRPRNPEEYVDKIELSLKEIDRVVETLGQLFLLAKMDSSTLLNEDSKVSLSELVNDTLIHYSTKIEKKKLKVNLNSTLELDDLVPKYYSSLIVDTIISNAIKYGKENAVLDINIDTENSRIKCVITDQGMGIKPEDLKKVFHRFYRSNPLNHKHIEGDGLGLSIAKKSAEAIGAEIKVESELNVGTSFIILF